MDSGLAIIVLALCILFSLVLYLRDRQSETGKKQIERNNNAKAKFADDLASIRMSMLNKKYVIAVIDFVILGFNYFFHLKTSNTIGKLDTALIVILAGVIGGIYNDVDWVGILREIRLFFK